jgi:hypothetical protein
MPKEWYLMGTNAYFSGYENEDFNDYASGGFTELLAVSPEAENVLINRTKKRVIIQNTMTENIKLISIRYMLSHIGDSKEGYYVDFKDNKWLVLAVPDNNNMYEKSVIQRCNHNLKWINKNNELIIRPCIEDTRTLYTTGIKDEKIIEIPNGMVGIQLPYDDETKLLERGCAFVFNKTKYEVTSYDQTTYPGLVVLICSEISISHMDDKVNEIANRWIDVSGEKIDRLPWLDNQEPPEQPTEPEPTEPQNITYKIEVIPQYQNDDGTEIYYGEWCKYAVHKFADGQEVNGNFTFEIETLNNPQNIELATLEIENNICKVIANNNAIMGGSIKLVATDTETGQIAIEKEIEIMGM